MLRFLGLAVAASAGLYAADLALVGARIYPAPDSPPIVRGTIVIHDGRISEVGDAAKVKAPRGSERIDCSGLTVVAGFWNSHVHFTEPKWQDAGSIPSETLRDQLRDMFTRYGFTSVFDSGSLLANTKTISKRIEAREVAGPMILSCGVPFAPKDATPYYLKPVELPQPADRGQATAMARERLNEGADGIKIFAGSWARQEPNGVVPMPVEIVKAITKEAHARGKPVFAHPSNVAGLRAALDGGVDVLTHVVEDDSGLTPALVSEIRKRRMAVIPTLKLFGRNRDLMAQLRSFSDAGIPILFGTDVGFITDYDPAEEFKLMDRAGLTFPQILSALTTTPATRHGFSKQKGRIAAGMDADLVVLAGDPAQEVTAFTDVRYTIRNGTVTYSAR